MQSNHYKNYASPFGTCNIHPCVQQTDISQGHMRFKSPFLLPQIQLEDYLLCGMFLGELDNVLYKHF